MMVVTDPPRHRQLRQPLARIFSPRGVRSLEPTVRRVVGQTLDHALAAQRIDWVRDVAAPIPVRVTAEILGIPPELQDELARLTSAIFASENTEDTASASRSRAQLSLLELYAELADDRRRSPRSDVLTLLATCRFGERKLDPDEVVLNCHNILLGGNETTRHAIAGGTLELIDNPDAFNRLRRDGVDERAIEEMLRWTSPGMHVARTAVRSTEIAGHSIEAGARVVVWLAAANRDPARFECPHDLTFDRTANNLAFGAGPHHCLGAAVARLQLKVFFEEFVSRVAHIERRGEVSYLASNFIGGVAEMPVWAVSA